MTILQKKKRNKEIKELYLSGVPSAEICVRYDLSSLNYLLKSMGIDPVEERKKKLQFCGTHPDRLSVCAGRCEECQKKAIRMRRYNYAVKNWKSTTQKTKEKPVFIPRELTAGEQRIRDRYKDVRYTGGMNHIQPTDFEINIRPRQ